MAANRRRSFVEGLASDILAISEESGRRRSAEVETAGDEVRCLTQLDYGRPLRTHLDRCEVREIVAEARRMVWPRLNTEPLRLGPLKEFAERASSLGVDFQIARLPGREGLALLGFYAKKMKGLFERPLICVNSAHHPAVMGTVFSHEMGHHVTCQVFGSHKELTNFWLYTGYADHLDDRVELAADVLACLGIYSEKIARRIFGSRDHRASRGLDALAKILSDVRGRYGFDFDAVPSIQKKAQYLATLIHYTKLRLALLDEYDI
jgi:hypothetical protein